MTLKWHQKNRTTDRTFRSTDAAVKSGFRLRSNNTTASVSYKHIRLRHPPRPCFPSFVCLSVCLSGLDKPALSSLDLNDPCHQRVGSSRPDAGGAKLDVAVVRCPPPQQPDSERASERERGQPCSQRGWVADQTTRRDKVGSKLQLTPKKSHRGVRAKKHIIQHHAGTLHSVRTQATQARPPLIGLSGINCEEAKRSLPDI